MDESKKKKLLKLAKLQDILEKGNPAIARFLFRLEDTIDEVSAKIENLVQSIAKENAESIDKLRLDFEEIKPTDERLVEIIKPLIPNVVDGKTPGKEELLDIIKPLIPKIQDGKTPTKEELLALIKPLIPNIDEDKIISKVVSMVESNIKLPDEEKIIKNIEEKVTNNIAKLGEPIRDSLELLKGKDRLSRNAIDGLDNYNEIVELSKEPRKIVKNYYGGSGGASTFIELTDTPNSYTGQAGKTLLVKGTEDGLEFGDATDTDEKVKYDASDPTAGYLADKIIAGTGITLAEGTGANENKLEIINTLDLSGYVPYTGATGDVDLGANNLTLQGYLNIGEFTNDALVIGDTSGDTRGNKSIDIQSYRSATTQVAGGAENIVLGIENTGSGEFTGVYGRNVLVGYRNTATGTSTFLSGAFGSSNDVVGLSSYAIGRSNDALNGGLAIGTSNTANVSESISIGGSNKNDGISSVLIGNSNDANSGADFNILIGNDNDNQGFGVNGDYNTVIGTESWTSGNYTSQIGFTNTIFADNSHCIGDNIYVGGANTFAMGSGLGAYFNNSFVFGNTTKSGTLNQSGLSIDNQNPKAGFHSTNNIISTDINDLGSELVTNGSFTGSATGWTLGTGWSYSSNKVRHISNGTGTLSQSLSITAGKYYLLSFSLTDLGVGSFNVSLGGDVSETFYSNNTSGTVLIRNYSRTIKMVFKAINTNGLIFTPSNDAYIATIDNVSVKEITGGDIEAIGDITGDSFIKTGATSDDVLLGDGSTTSLAGIVTTPAGSDTHIQFNDSGAFGGNSDFIFNNSTKVLDFGGGMNTVVGADSITTSWEGSNDDYENVGTNSYSGQGFQIPANANITAIGIYGSRGNASSGTFKVEILSGSYPSGTVEATTGTLTSSTSLTSYGTPQWNKLTLTAPVALTTGTQYWIKLTPLSGGTVDEVRWSIDTTSPTYTGGNSYSGAGGSSGSDRNFRVYKEGVTTRVFYADAKTGYFGINTNAPAYPFDSQNDSFFGSSTFSTTNFFVDVSTGYNSIGRLNPEYPLHIEHSVTAGLVIEAPTPTVSNLDSPQLRFIAKRTGGVEEYFSIAATPDFALEITQGGLFPVQITDGRMLFVSGSVSAPTYTFISDSNTGIFNPASDALGFVTGGIERARFDSSGNFGIGTTTPSAKLHSLATTEQLRLGYDASNYLSATVSSDNTVTLANGVAADININCGTDKTIVLTETVWNDLQYSISSGRVSASNFPDWDTFTTNTSEYKFDVNDYIDLASQELPHWWKEGTAGKVHIHTALDGANSSGSNQYAKFTLYIAYANNASVWAETTKDIEITIPTGTADMTELFGAASTDLTLTGLTIGAQVKIRIKRIAATSGTEYPNHIFINQVGIHLEQDTIGSRQVAIK